MGILIPFPATHCLFTTSMFQIPSSKYQVNFLIYNWNKSKRNTHQLIRLQIERIQGTEKDKPKASPNKPVKTTTFTVEKSYNFGLLSVTSRELGGKLSTLFDQEKLVEVVGIEPTSWKTSVMGTTCVAQERVLPPARSRAAGGEPVPLFLVRPSVEQPWSGPAYCLRFIPLIGIKGKTLAALSGES